MPSRDGRSKRASKFWKPFFDERRSRRKKVRSQVSVEEVFLCPTETLPVLFLEGSYARAMCQQVPPRRVKDLGRYDYYIEVALIPKRPQKLVGLQAESKLA